jgi:hypothetical protein
MGVWFGAAVCSNGRLDAPLTGCIALEKWEKTKEWQHTESMAPLACNHLSSSIDRAIDETSELSLGRVSIVWMRKKGGLLDSY